MSLAQTLQSHKPTILRLIRYLVVGGGVNAALYGVYLLLSMGGNIAPLISASLVYALGIAMTYIGNTFWAFKSKEQGKPEHANNVPRYIATYVVGYVIQILVLWAIPLLTPITHQFAQLIAMVCAAGSIFLLLNKWVYSNKKSIKK